MDIKRNQEVKGKHVQLKIFVLYLGVIAIVFLLGLR